MIASEGGKSPPKPDTLRLRLLSAAVLAPAALALAWFGPPYLSVAALAAAVVMGSELGRMAGGGRIDGSGAAVILGEFLGVGAAALGRWEAALAILVAGAIGAALAALPRDRRLAPWFAFGALWIGLPTVALVWLAADPIHGRATVLWVFFLVWATDSAAYLVGRSLGGPRLAPRWSPRKTWSGALGGLVAAGAVGAVAAQLLGSTSPFVLILTSLAISAASQVGDLGESLVKRHFGVKDAGSLIPGHGGLLDRLDGMLAALAAVAGVSLLTGVSPVAWGA